MPTGGSATPREDADRAGIANAIVGYVSHSVRESHPDRVATIATLLGVDPPPTGNCRVLELGCGDGGNLIPMAASLPQASFFGCDLAGHAIAAGRRFVAETGLANVNLLAADIAELPASLGQFDYIVAHGFYSWVPDPVRETMMALIGARLAPNGVAYASYNVLPGCHLRRIAWDAMQYHTRRIVEPRAKVAAARELLGLLIDGGATAEEADAAVRAEFRWLAGRTDSLLFHDDLAPVNGCFYFHEFVDHARRHGLTFLGEADLRAMTGAGLSRAMQQAVVAMDRLEREQYLDFFRLQRFRRTLLTRAPSISGFGIVPDRIAAMRVRAAPSLVSAAFDAEREGRPIASAIPTADPRIQSLLAFLIARAPHALPFAEIAAWWHAQPGADPRRIEFVLAEIYLGGGIELSLFEPPLTALPGERPKASPIARREARDRDLIANLWHEAVGLDDPLLRRLVALCDGTRDRGALLDALRADFACGAPEIDAALRYLARVALLAA